MKNLKNGQFDAPADLSPQSRRIWASLVPRRVRSCERLVLLTQALKALDRADDLERQLAEVPLLTKTPASLMPHTHPLVRLAADARKEWRTLWLALGLGIDVLDRMDERHWKTSPGIGLPCESEVEP